MAHAKKKGGALRHRPDSFPSDPDEGTERKSYIPEPGP